MSMEVALDLLDPGQLRALVHHQQVKIDRLLAERETHLAQVEAAFRRRHNAQMAMIAKLEGQLKAARKRGAA